MDLQNSSTKRKTCPLDHKTKRLQLQHQLQTRKSKRQRRRALQMASRRRNFNLHARRRNGPDHRRHPHHPQPHHCTTEQHQRQPTTTHLQSAFQHIKSTPGTARRSRHKVDNPDDQTTSKQQANKRQLHKRHPKTSRERLRQPPSHQRRPISHEGQHERPTRTTLRHA